MNADKKLEIERSLLGKKVKLLAFYRGADEIDYEFGIVNQVLSIDFDTNKRMYCASRLSLHLFNRQGKMYMMVENTLKIPIPTYVDFHISDLTILTDNCYPVDEVVINSVGNDLSYFDILDPLNPISKIATHPDLTLDFLEIVTAYRLTSEQRTIAIMSATDLKRRQSNEVTMRDLVQMWDGSATLQEFAVALRKIFILG